MASDASAKLWLVRAGAWLSGAWAFRSARRTARLLHGFARTEAQSNLELRRAARVCDDEARRALYLRHALDETRHAQAFAERASRLALAAGGPGLGSPSAASEDLFEALGEARFLAFVYRGERRGRTQFEVYAGLLRRRGQSSLAELFERLVLDERQHEAYSLKLLHELVGPLDARRALGWAARADAWRAFRRIGRRLAGGVYLAGMLLIYVLLAPYALVVRASSRPRRGFSREA